MIGLIPAAGRGTRLGELTANKSKELLIVGKPVIEHVIEVLKAGGIREILIIIGRNKEAIMNYLGSGERLGVKIYYRIQEKTKGSAHATYLGKDFVGSEDFVLMYGDNYFKPYETINSTLKIHLDNKAFGTLLLHSVEDPSRYGIVKVDSQGKVVAIIEKPSMKEAKSYQSNGKYSKYSYQ